MGIVGEAGFLGGKVKKFTFCTMQFRRANENRFSRRRSYSIGTAKRQDFAYSLVYSPKRKIYADKKMMEYRQKGTTYDCNEAAEGLSFRRPGKY